MVHRCQCFTNSHTYVIVYLTLSGLWAVVQATAWTESWIHSGLFPVVSVLFLIQLRVQLKRMPDQQRAWQLFTTGCFWVIVRLERMLPSAMMNFPMCP